MSNKNKNNSKPAPTAEQPKPQVAAVVKVDKLDCSDALEHLQK